MAVDIKTPDHFLIGLTNYVADGYSKNGDDKIGGYGNRTAYIWECLAFCDISGISAGSTINSVTIDVNVTTNTTIAANDLTVHEQNKTSWTDDGSTEPKWDNPAALAVGTWPSSLANSALFSDTGLKTVTSTAALVALFQDFVDGVKDAADGVILCYQTDYFGYYLTQNAITFNVDYTAASGANRRIFIC